MNFFLLHNFSKVLKQHNSQILELFLADVSQNVISNSLGN